MDPFSSSSSADMHIFKTQATRIRELEDDVSRAEKEIRTLEFNQRTNSQRESNLRRDLDNAKNMILLMQWLLVSAGIIILAIIGK